MLSENHSVLLAAVGGQGALSAARILGCFAMGLGGKVKVSEVHGMSQRGGSVVTHVRFGPEVHSPVIERGALDTLIAFEVLEAARYADFLRPGGTVVVSDQRLAPLPVLTGAANYPPRLLDELASLPVSLHRVAGLKLAELAGNAKTVNSVLLGVYAWRMGFERQAWHQAIGAVVPARYLEVNRLAFDLGFDPERSVPIGAEVSP